MRQRGEAGDARPATASGSAGGEVLVVPPDAPAGPWSDGSTVRVLVPGEATGGAWALLEHTWSAESAAAAAAAAKSLHVHRSTDQTFVVLEGAMVLRLDDRVFTAHAGTTVLIPRGQPHANWCAGPQRTRVLMVVSPAGLEQLFVDGSALVAARGNGPDVLARLQALTRRHDSHPADARRVSGQEGNA